MVSSRQREDGSQSRLLLRQSSATAPRRRVSVASSSCGLTAPAKLCFVYKQLPKIKSTAGSAMDANIVENWLRSLNMVQYTQSFLDNGYDDLEICKQIGPEDLDAIGVLRADHREEVLAAVQHLREHGGTAVYFTLDPEYQRIHGLGPYNNGLGPARGIPYNVQRSLDLDHAVVVRTTNGHGCFLESGACGSSSSGGGDVLTYDTTSPSPNKCPVHSNYVENSILGNVSVCVTNGYSGGGGGGGYNPVGNISPGGGAGGDGGSGSQPGSGTITPAWLSPTHRPLTVPIALSNGGGIQGGGLPVSQPQVPLPPPPPPPPPPLGGFPSINSARVGVPLPLPPCQRCLGEDLAQQQQHDFPPCSTCLGASPLSPQQHYLEGKQTLVTFTRLQLTAILRDKLETDCIVLTEEKYLKKVCNSTQHPNVTTELFYIQCFSPNHDSASIDFKRTPQFTSSLH